MPEKDVVGVVLGGGGARGAYEAGALSVLLPLLERRGERPSIFVGTSVGAINAAYLASTQHMGAEEAAEGGLAHWEEVTPGHVMRRLLPDHLLRVALRYAGELLSVPGVRLPALLDSRPLGANLRRWIEWSALHRNVESGLVHSVAAVATSARSGESVAFTESRAPRDLHPSHVVRYAWSKLTEEHVRASAAIPILFPPVRIDTPSEARGWYVDGGTRLNTPIKPALDLGVDRVVVVGTDSVVDDTSIRDEALEPPDFGDGALHLLQGALVDPLVEDMRMLGNVNTFFSEPERAPGARAYREARGKPPYRKVPYIFIAPGRRGAIGELAAEVMSSRYRGIRRLRSPDIAALDRLLGRDSPSHGELLSYLLFDPDFIRELVAQGKRDAQTWLRAPPGPEDPWQVGPLDAFTRR